MKPRNNRRWIAPPPGKEAFTRHEATEPEIHSEAWEAAKTEAPRENQHASYTQDNHEVIRPIRLALEALEARIIPSTAPTNITAFVAKQKVNQFVLMEISTHLRGLDPNLEVGERLCWSVPVEMALPSQGSLGRVGEIRVDAMTGELLVDQGIIARIAHNIAHFMV